MKLTINKGELIMRRTQNWVNRVVREDHAEVEWQTRGSVQVRWNHNNRVITVWVV